MKKNLWGWWARALMSCTLILASPQFVRAESAKAAKTKAAPTSADIKPSNPNQVDLDMVTRIRQEEFRHSQVMSIMSDIADGIGPRLTNSPNMRKANAWARDQFTKWGLENAHLEPWGPFGRGWAYEISAVRMVSPDRAELIALPKAWTPGTNGAVRGKVVRAKITSKKDFEKYKGKLSGAIVLIGEDREIKPHSQAELQRYSDKELDEIFQYEIPKDRSDTALMERLRRAAFNKELTKFLDEEKPLAVIEETRSPGDGGTIFVQSGGSYKKDEPIGPPYLVMAAEHFGRIARLLSRKVDVELEVNVKADFYDDDAFGYNTLAEIPGTDLKDEVVMLGGHLDSWHGGTGATDNGAGCAVAMEAVRLIKALGIKPRRTIRIALWSGEEQGLLGSRGYVKEHFAVRPEDPDEHKLPEFMRRLAGPLQLKPEQSKVTAYFNLDNGTGKIRGIHLQENAAVAPIFASWMEPFKDLGMTTLTMRNTGGTDHLSFDAAGIPGFQFIQDEIEYDTRTHHSNLDVYERIQREDMMQASAIMASFVYDAAMRDQMLPRKPLPQPEPKREAPKDADEAEKN